MRLGVWLVEFYGARLGCNLSLATERATPSWGGAAAAPAADITLRNAIRIGMENRARAAGRMWVKYILHTLWVRSAKIYNAAAR